MFFNIWPKDFQSPIEGKLNLKATGLLLLAACALLIGLYLFIRSDYFLVMALITALLGANMLIQHRTLRRQTDMRLFFTEDTLEVRNAGGHLLKAIKYAEVTRIESRLLRLTDLPKGWRFPEFSTQEVIIIYSIEASCFEELKLEESPAWKGYWGSDLFSHKSCIALAYDDEAWKCLEHHCGTR